MSSQPAPVPRRALPGGGPSVSLLGFVVDPLGPTGPPAERALVERLRRARNAGVNVFDTVSSRDPDRARAVLEAAFPSPDRDVVVLVRGVEEEQPSRLGDPLTTGATSHPREPWPFQTLHEIAPSLREGAEGTERSPTSSPAPRVMRLDPAMASLPVHSGADLYSGPFSLLERRLRRLFESPVVRSPVGLLARDPFAGGRLDGSRFAQSWLALGPTGAPASLRLLEREFEPVLRLGFLTSHRSRTLAQAAIQYVASHPWVVSVLAPLPPADRLEELLETFTRPALTPEELARVEAEPAAPSLPSPGPSLK